VSLPGPSHSTSQASALGALRVRASFAIGAALAGVAAIALGSFAATGNLPTAIGLTTGAILIGATGVSHFVQRRVAPLVAAFEALERIASGDLAARVEDAGEDGPAALVNRVGTSFATIATRLGSTSGRMSELPARFRDGIREIYQASDAQEAAVEETASLMADINASIRGINKEVESLSTVTEEASSSILEMGSSIDEVARSVEQLHGSVDSSTASIHQVSASMRQISESADAVEAMAEESAAAITEMDRAIQQVGEHVREAAVLTDRVSQEAEDGAGAVSATIEGIETIRSLTRDARDVLERLAGRIAEIGEILTVIGGINEETNLLSLNAAIIAAQAGEQGKAFAVVANHVKTLAQRTAGATQEIERLIHAVQDESRNAVQAMGSGMQAVETGVERSKRAGSALAAIRGSAHDASARVAEIARAATEQTRNSAHVAEAAQRTSAMVQQMSGALAEQRRAGENLLRNAESALELCRQVHRSTEEQRQSSRFVRDNIASITEMIRAFQENTSSHSRASDQVSTTAARILEVTQQTGKHLPALTALVEELRVESSELAEALAFTRG
jgi:methyl-accepting chemotaxis protein